MLRLVAAGAPERKKLDALRTQRAEHEAQLEELREQAVPLEEAVKLVMLTLQEPRERARGWLQYFIHPGGTGAVVDGLGFTALLLPDLEQRVRELLQPMIKNPGLPRDKREAEVRALEVKLQELRRKELAEFVALERRDLVVELPEDLDHAELLRLWDL